jgi:hypothetical protein
VALGAEMTAQEIERLAVVEQQIADVCDRVVDLRADIRSMDSKLDAVLNSKADKTAVSLLEERMTRVANHDDLRRKADKADVDDVFERVKWLRGLVIGVGMYLLQGHLF